MMQYYEDAKRAQFELQRKQEENMALKAETARLRMELSLSQSALQEREGRIKVSMCMERDDCMPSVF